MAFWFGDSFDLYAAPADAIAGYWDSGTVGFTLVAGRFSGSRAAQNSANTGWLVKSSGSNDAVHHIVCAFQQSAAISGTTLGLYFQLTDGTTNQCCIVFRSDGAILLTSATPAGTVLATYTGAVTAANTWYAFEFEVVINNTTGSFAVRKNGNTSNDFTLGSLNTRPGTNSYANKLTVGQNATVTSQQVDDLLWRSDASSVPWVGDIRCFTRMPASDASVAWTPSGSAVPQTPFPTAASSQSLTTTAAFFAAFTPVCNGAVGTATLPLFVADPGNLKCSIFGDNAGRPGSVLGSATPLNNQPIGNSTFTFSTPVSVSIGTQYWVGFMSDTAVTNGCRSTAANVTGGAIQTGASYAAFPTANPTVTTPSNGMLCTINVTPSGVANAPFVAEPQQDAANSYVASSTVGQSDLYGIAAIASTPTTIVGVTTRGYCQKSDAGTRNVSIQLKSGGTTVASASTALNTTWAWISRTDLTDPATGAAWTATGVNNATIGPIVTA